MGSSWGIMFSCCGLGSEQGLSGTGITVHSQHVLSRSIRLGAAGLANLLFRTLLGMGLAKSSALTLLRAAAVPRSVHKCWQRLSWGRAKHGSHAQNSLERLKRRNASGKSCFAALGSDRSRAEKSSFVRVGTGSVLSHAVLGELMQPDCSYEAANQGERLQLLSSCHPFHGLRDWLYLPTRATPCTEQLCHGAARFLLPPDLLL